MEISAAPDPIKEVGQLSNERICGNLLKEFSADAVPRLVVAGTTKECWKLELEYAP